jgi:hypothetical protein
MKIFKAEPLHLHNLNDEQIGLVDRLFFKREQMTQGFYRRMFDEDFARLFHSINHQGGKLFNITSNDDGVTQRLLGNFKMRSSPHSVDATIRELVEQIAQSLIHFGRAHYFCHEDREQQEIHAVSISAGGIFSPFGKIIQWVPKRKGSHWNRDDEEHGREIRILDKSKVMLFDMPKLIKYLLSAQNTTLAVLDKHKSADVNLHLQVTHENPNPTKNFNFLVWKDTQERALFLATRGTGWNGRQYYSSKLSNFFECHSLIRFRRNQLLLRDDILNQLSDELSKVGKYYNAKFSVKISSTSELPNVEYLDELEMKLANEEVGFDEISDYCYKH